MESASSTPDRNKLIVLQSVYREAQRRIEQLEREMKSMEEKHEMAQKEFAKKLDDMLRDKETVIFDFDEKEHALLEVLDQQRCLVEEQAHRLAQKEEAYQREMKGEVDPSAKPSPGPRKRLLSTFLGRKSVSSTSPSPSQEMEAKLAECEAEKEVLRRRNAALAAQIEDVQSQLVEKERETEVVRLARRAEVASLERRIIARNDKIKMLESRIRHLEKVDKDEEAIEEEKEQGPDEDEILVEELMIHIGDMKEDEGEDSGWSDYEVDTSDNVLYADPAMQRWTVSASTLPRRSPPKLPAELLEEDPEEEEESHSEEEEDEEVPERARASSDGPATPRRLTVGKPLPRLPDQPPLLRKIRAASLNKLLERLTHSVCPDPEFQHAFLLTYKRFTTAPILLHRLIQRYNHRTPPEERLRIRLAVCNVIKSWIQFHFEDFDATTLSVLLKFVDTELSLSSDEGTRGLAQHIRRVIAIGAGVVGQAAQEKDVDLPPAPLQPKGEWETLWEWPVEEIARQLCLMESAAYHRITAQELLAWCSTARNHRKRARVCPNLVQSVDRFNAVSHWVADQVLGEERVKDRRARIVFVISIVEHLIKLRNYNSSLQLVAGLQINAVYRLKKTWSSLPSKSKGVFSEATALFDTQMNRAAYRSALRGLSSDGMFDIENNKVTAEPCVPYVGLCLSDLTSIEESTDYIGSLINFAKFQQIGKIIQNFLSYQCQYNFQSLGSLQHALLVLGSDLEEEDMREISVELEPLESKG